MVSEVADVMSGLQHWLCVRNKPCSTGNGGRLTCKLLSHRCDEDQQSALLHLDAQTCMCSKSQ